MTHRLRQRFTTILIGLLALLLAACDPAQLLIKPPTSGNTGQALPLRNEILSRVEMVARPEMYDTPWDATPDPDGKLIYFTATGRYAAGVYRVPATGGDTAQVAVGDPFVTPLGLAISTDGQQLYVADPKAKAADGRVGQIFVVSAAGGAPTPLAGTQGTTPRGLEVVNEKGADMIYFSGVDPKDGQPAVLKIAAQGTGELSVIAKGAPLVEPVGIAVTNKGVIYVADRLASGNNLGSVFRIDGGKVETIADHFRTGTPVVGATLTLDESALLVSALALDRDSAEVLLIELPSLNKGIVNKVIEANTGSGGVHRAHKVNLFAWADTRANKQSQKSLTGNSQAGGGVYALNP